MNVSNMPKLTPLPILTKDQLVWLRAWHWITSIRKWQLIDDWRYQLPDGQPVVVIPKTFVFDGTSIPRLLWWLLSPTGILFIPGLIHDFAYRYDYLWAIDPEGYAYKYKENRGRKTWDLIFRRVGLSVSGIATINIFAWITLATLGSIAWRSNRKQKAPEIEPDIPIRLTQSGVAGSKEGLCASFNRLCCKE